MKKNIILSAALMFFGLTAQAQTTITFDTDDYEAISVYDSWEESPFRAETPIIDWEAGVVANPDTKVDEVLGKAPNTTGNVVKLRRSRHGSNTFGVRIDLKEPIRLTKQLQYIHIMAYLKDKPAESRMMVIGLGKRIEESWNWQTGEDEQFWATTTSNIKPKEGWQDIVVSFKGFSYSKEENANSGIDIHSLVIVPDVRSPHADAADWYAYIDEIVIDNTPDKRFSTDKYALTYEKDAATTRNDRKLNSVGLTSADVSYSSAAINGKVYSDNTAKSVFSAKAGTEVQPTFGYSGNWMSGYVYVDWNNDGRFDYEVNEDGTPAVGSEIVSYSAAQIDGTWYKSDGTTTANGNTIGAGVPKFTVPAGTPTGLYRMRYKVDWDNRNPAGANDIISNGGGYIDVMLDVHGDNVAVNASQLNGDIKLAVDESALQNYSAAYGQPLKVKIVPAPGFVQYGFILKYGYNVNASQQLDDNGNPNWVEVSVPYSVINGDGTYDIPAEYMRGSQVSIKGDMQQEQLYTVEVTGLPDNTLGGAVYANIETKDGGTIRATQFFSAEQVTPATVENYDGAVALEDRKVTITYTLSAKPYKEVASLSELKNYKLYQIKSKNNMGYWAYNSTITNEYVSVRGASSFPNGEPSNEATVAKYKEEVSPFDETTVWRIILEEGKYYLYQPERKAYLTRSGRDYKFTETKNALDGIRVNEGNHAGTFSFHAGGGYNDESIYFACIANNEATTALRNWTWNDHGSVMQIIENPNVYTLEYTVEITGHTHGRVIFDDTEYANGSTVTVTEFLTAADVEVKTIVNHTSEVTVDKENGRITVVYTPPTVVTSINPEMLYTLECRSGAAHNTARFIGDNGTVINGQSSTPTYFMFEPAEKDGTYYIKSVVSGRYINSDGTNLSASTTKNTAWTFGVGGKDNVTGVVTFGLTGDKYLNNNGTKCTDGTITNLQPNYHQGGPGSGNACSLWEMCEFEPTYNDYLVTVLGDASATVTFDGQEFENGATIRTLNYILKDDITPAEVEGKMTIVNIDGTTIYVSYIDQNTPFYTIRHHGGSYVSLNAAYTDGNGNLKLTNSTAVADETGYWAFVSQDGGGFKIYNYTTGLYKVLGMTDSEANARASMVAHDNTTHTTTFYGTLNLEDNSTASYIRMANVGNNYWNKRGDYLALWNSSDATGSDTGSRFYLTKITPETVTIGEHGIATFYSNTSALIPEGVTAYVATTAPVMNGKEGTITMTEIADGIIPAKTGAVLRGTADTYNFEYTSQAGTPVTGNLLRGYAGNAEHQEVALPTDGSTNYVLAVENEKAGFYRKESSFNVYNHKAYLNVPATQGVRSLTIRFGDDDTTGIEMTTDYRLQSTAIYDLMGRRVEKMEKGIYIVNGKKVVK